MDPRIVAFETELVAWFRGQGHSVYQARFSGDWFVSLEARDEDVNLTEIAKHLVREIIPA